MIEWALSLPGRFGKSTLDSATGAMENSIPVNRRLRWLEKNGIPTDRGIVQGEDYPELREDYEFSSDHLDEYGYVRRRGLKRRAWDSVVNRALSVNYSGILRFAVAGTGGYLVNQAISMSLEYIPDIPGAANSLLHSAAGTAGVVGGYRASYWIQNGIQYAVDETRKRMYI